MGSGPDFIGIGAPRCGTTWLHRSLRLHPAVWLPPVKEVHFFDSVDASLRPRHRVERVAGRVRRHLAGRLLHGIGAAGAPVAAKVRSRVKPDLAWDRAHFSPGGSLDWYRSLFDRPDRGSKVVGEIMPAYIALPAPTIEMIRRGLETRCFLIVSRDPMVAAWSGLARRAGDWQATPPDEIGEAALAKALLGAFFSLRQYGINLARWFEVFGRKAFLAGFLEEVVDEPEAPLDRARRFIGVELLGRTQGPSLRERSSAAGDLLGGMRDSVLRQLATALEPDLRTLSALIGGRCASWRQSAVRALG